MRLNTISCAIERNRYLDEVPGIWIDGERLAVIAERASTLKDHADLVSVLLPARWTSVRPEQRLSIRQALFPDDGMTSVAPILMCPDDLDLSCTLVVVEVQRLADVISWRRLGARLGHPHREDSWAWWPSFVPLHFDHLTYAACFQAFEDASEAQPSRE